MTSKRIVPLSEYHRLPQASQTPDYYKRLLEVVCNNATLALLIMDEHQQCVYMNPAAEALTGYTLSETKGRALHDVIHHTRPDGRPYPLCECPIDQAFPQNNQEQGEEVFVHKDGHFYPVAYTASPIREGDRTIGTIIEVRDITQEKLAEQARHAALLREQALRTDAEASQRQVTQLLERMTDAFVTLDCDWRITYLNAEAERLNRKPRDATLGKTHWEEWSASVGTNVEHQYRRAMAEQIPVHFEHRYYDPPHYDVWLEIHAYPSADGLGIFYRDISDRKRAEVELQTLNRQLTRRVDELETLFNLLPIGVAIAKDPDCHNIRGNPYLADLMRVSGDTNISQSNPADQRPDYRLCLDGQDIPATDLPMQSAAQRNTVMRDTVIDLVHPDGTVIKLLCYAAPLRDEQGNVRGALGAFIDITQRMLTETALRESQALFEAFMRYAPVTAFIKDEAGRYLYVNSLAERLSQHSRTELLGKTDFDVFAIADAQQWRDHDLAALTAGRAIEIEENLTLADGKHYFMSFKFPIPQPSGQHLLGGMSLDVTERKQTEMALRRSEEQLRLATDGANLGMWFWDVQTNTLTWTDRAKAMFGLPLDTEMTMAVFLEAVHPDDRPLVQAIVTDLAAGHIHVENEYRTLWSDGTVRWILAKGDATYDDNGNLIATQGVLMDITERKRVEAERQRAEDSLRQSEARLQTLANNVPAIVWTAAPDGTIVWVSDAWYAYTGITAEQNARNWFQVVHPDDVEPCLSQWHTALAEGKPYEVEVRNRRQDGEYRWFLTQAIPMRDEQGTINAWFGSTTDIHEKKVTEAALWESMAILNTVNQATPTLIYVKDRQERMLMANPATINLLGKSETAILTNTGDRFLNSDDAMQISRNDRQVMETGQVHVFEETVNLPAGPRTFLSTKSPYRDEQGNIIGLIGVSTDITERKQAELEREQLLARERHYVNQLQGLTTAALAINSALSIEQLLQVITDQAAAIIGTHQSVTSMTINQNWAQAINAIYLSDKYTQWQDYQAKPDGSGIYGCICHMNRAMRMTQAELEAHPRWRNFGKEADNHPPLRGWLAAPLTGRDGQNIGLIQLSDKWEGEFTEADEAILVQMAQMASVAIENARLYEAEQQARSIAEASREEAQAANRIKDEFLAVLSHELRSPLNPILGWSKLLQSGRLDEARTKQAITTIERNAKLQAELIEDLLDVSRILRGKLNLNVTPVNLAVVIKAAIETVRLAAEAKSIDVRSTVCLDKSSTTSQSATIQVAGDATRLQQIVWNLLSNAVKFTPAGGWVEVNLESIAAPAPVSPSGTPHTPPYAQITIRDNGKGISPDFLPHVFEYFRQADSATTRKFGGLGLGLAIVRHLVELHGGTIQADSPGEDLGATFTVKLPLLGSRDTRTGNGETDANPLPHPQHTLLLGLHILVVDDDTDTREFVTFLLEQSGATVVAVASASEALSRLPQFQPDVLLSDIGMPETDGYMLMQHIRALPPNQGGKVRAIALTAYAGDFNQRQALQAGFQQHLAKPIDADMLIQAITALMQTSQP